MNGKPVSLRDINLFNYLLLCLVIEYLSIFFQEGFVTAELFVSSFSRFRAIVKLDGRGNLSLGNFQGKETVYRPSSSWIFGKNFSFVASFSRIPKCSRFQNFWIWVCKSFKWLAVLSMTSEESDSLVLLVPIVIWVS